MVSMARKSVKRKTTRIKRFTVSLPVEDYNHLLSLAEGHRPPLSLQYVVGFAVCRLLDVVNTPDTLAQLGNPLNLKTDNHEQG
jgi:hypothetical protein